MRTQTFIVSMTSALVFAGAAQATVAPFTFDSFTDPQSLSNGSALSAGINWASPASSQPIFGASGTRAAFTYNYGNGGTTTSSVSGGTATFTTTTVGGAGAGLYYSGSAQDLTGYTFSFYLNSTVATGSGEGFFFDLEDVSGGYSTNEVNYTSAGTYTVDLSMVQAINLTAITSIGINIYTGAAGSATVSNFTYAPAPGALALLGAAGLVGARRRRA